MPDTPKKELIVSEFHANMAKSFGHTKDSKQLIVLDCTRVLEIGITLMLIGLENKLVPLSLSLSA